MMTPPPSPFAIIPNPLTLAPIELAKSYRLLNHGPTTLATSAHNGVRNVMAAVWVMPLDFDPFKVPIVVNSRILTHELIETSAVFALNTPTCAVAETILAADTLTGRDGDKFEALGLATVPARTIGVPLMAGYAGWLECRVILESRNKKRYDLFIVEVTAAWADPALFSNGRWHFTDAGSKTLHYLADGVFFEIGEAFTVQVKQP